MDSQPTPSQGAVTHPEYAAPEWLNSAGASQRGFFITRQGASEIALASDEAQKIIESAAPEWKKGHGKDDAKSYESAKIVSLPDVDNAAYVALEPSDCSTDVGALATWIVEQLGEGAKFLQRPTHISRMIPVEGISGELDLVALAANVLPKHFDAIRRRGLRSATYEVIYEELHPSVHLFPSIVNAAIGDCLPEGYEIDLKKPSHSIICVVAGATAFMSVVEHYREKSKHFALHKALSAAA